MDNIGKKPGPFAPSPSQLLYISSVVARICCLDLDTFFVSVERLFDPTLVGKPVLVGGKRGSPGVVTAASYEARAFGIRSGMSLKEASRLAPPNAVFLPTRHGVYSDYSDKVRAILDDFTPEVRAASIDEFYMDFHGCEELYRCSAEETGDAIVERTVREMCQRIAKETGLPASAGIGGSRIIAKIGSGLAKPAGVLFVPRGSERDFLVPLAVRKLPGIGPKAELRLHADGIHTLGELLALPTGPARARHARLLALLESEVRGRERPAPLARERPAFSEHDPEGLAVGSISNERTFFAALGNDERVLSQLLQLAERVCHRARKRCIRARTITLKLRTTDFHTITRGRTIQPTAEDGVVFRTLSELYRGARPRRLGVRLLGVQLSNLVGIDDPEQLPLPFTPPWPVGRALDRVREKYGYDSLHFAASLRRGK